MHILFSRLYDNLTVIVIITIFIFISITIIIIQMLYIASIFYSVCVCFFLSFTHARFVIGPWAVELACK
jgi:hypothetical protein